MLRSEFNLTLRVGTVGIPFYHKPPIREKYVLRIYMDKSYLDGDVSDGLSYLGKARKHYFKILCSNVQFCLKLF